MLHFIYKIVSHYDRLEKAVLDELISFEYAQVFLNNNDTNINSERGDLILTRSALIKKPEDFIKQTKNETILNTEFVRMVNGTGKYIEQLNDEIDKTKPTNIVINQNYWDELKQVYRMRYELPG